VWQAALHGITTFDDAVDLASIRVPTLLLAGDRDPYFPLAEQEQIRAAIRGAQLKVYAATGHNPHWKHPHLVAADLEAFIRAS
jgi:pimeloyl-ACP methyl ester carboxylesterase